MLVFLQKLCRENDSGNEGFSRFCYILKEAIETVYCAYIYLFCVVSVVAVIGIFLPLSFIYIYCVKNFICLLGGTSNILMDSQLDRNYEHQIIKW